MFFKRLNLIYFANIFLIIVSLFSAACNTPKRIVIHENSNKEKNKLVVNTIFRKFEIGIVLFKPWSLGFNGAETVYNLGVLNSDEVVLWEIDLENKNRGRAIITYGKLPKSYKQIFPLNNNFPEDLLSNSKYKIKLVTTSGTYHKEFLYQPGEIYLLNSDKLSETK